MREPAKAIYEAMEHDGETEFEYFLAEKLHMTRGDLVARMSNREFVEWSIYFGRKQQFAELAAKK